MKVKSCPNLNLVVPLVLMFLVLAITAHFIPYFSFDLYLTQKIQMVNNSWFHSVMWLISLPGNTNVLPLTLSVVLAVLLLIKHRLGIITSLIGLSIAVSASAMIKILVHRFRPDASLVINYDQLNDMSFPSSHALSYTLILGFLIYLTQKEVKNHWLQKLLTIVFLILIILVGISRIYLGVHWFSDVVGGYLLGAISLHFTICLYRHFKLHSI